MAGGIHKETCTQSFNWTNVKQIIISKQEDNLRMMVKKMIEIHKETGTQLNPCEDKHNYTSVCNMISKQETN